MTSVTYHYNKSWDNAFDLSYNTAQTLIIIFGSSTLSTIESALIELSSAFPLASIVGASTAGEIYQDELYDESLSVVMMQFSSSTVKVVSEQLSEENDSFSIGQNLAKNLDDAQLKALFVLSDGLQANGSKLTEGIASVLSTNVVVTGGLAGDGDRFEHTWTLVEGQAREGYVTAVGLYGDALHVSHGSKGGWDSLGVERVITRSTDNILYELDGQPALEVYKKYLGDKASGLPATGLLFPLEIKSTSNTEVSKVRTILAVNEEENSITFAGDVPKGSYVTLMKANYDRLINGAILAADEIDMQGHTEEDIVCLAISCVGRRLVLKQRVEEELEATLEVLPSQVKQVGFYSYGEISPLSSGQCDLHNQTMTLTLIWEENAPAT